MYIFAKDIDGQNRFMDVLSVNDTGNPGDGCDYDEIIDIGADEYNSHIGDLDCDGVVDIHDINPFVLALSNPEGYATMYSSCDILNADINLDGSVDIYDINPFVALLAST